MKRGRKDSLTGGTNDVSPQTLTVLVDQSAADTARSIEIPLPVTRIASDQAPTIIEILKVKYYNYSNYVETDNDIEVFLSTKDISTAARFYGNAACFSAFGRAIRITTSGSWVNVEPFTDDLNDGAGHGILIATDKIFAYITSGSTGIANQVDVKITYRFKRVSVLEYVGIVQSQQ